MKRIADICFFESERENVPGADPNVAGKIFKLNEKILEPVILRFVMKLREKRIYLPDFNFIYINLTTCLEPGKFLPANRPFVSYFNFFPIDRCLNNFFRFVDFGADPEKFNALPDGGKSSFLINASAAVICGLYCGENDELKRTVELAAEEILRLGENAVIIRKKRSNENYRANICVRVSDDLLYLPSVRIYGKNEVLLKEYAFDNAMPLDEFIHRFGVITIKENCVTVKPIKSDLSREFSQEALKILF